MSKKDKNLRLLKFTMGAIGAFFVLGVISLFIALKIGISGGLLTSEMQSILSKQLGNFADITLSNTRLSLDQDYHIALEAENVFLKDIKSGVVIDRIGQFKIGLSTLNLLKGRLKIEQIELHDSNIILPKSKNGNILEKLPQDRFGRVDPDAIANQLFPAFDTIAKIQNSISLNNIILKNISLRQYKEESEPLFIENLEVRKYENKLNLLSSLKWKDKILSLNGEANYQAQSARNIHLKLLDMPLHLGAADGVSPFLANGRTNIGHFKLKGKTDIFVDAQRIDENTPPEIRMKLSMENGLLDLGTEQNIPSQFDINLEHLPQSRKIEITPSSLIFGGLKIPFNGAVGLVPATDDFQKPEHDYRFELLSNEAVSALAEIPEKALNFTTKIAGQFRVSDRKATIDELVLNTTNGNIMGQGSLRFGVGTPETIFVLHSANFDIAEAKQIWPVNIAPSARQWVATHIFGGTLKNSILEIALPLGFFKSGVPSEPLTEKEIKVRAEIINTRSDLVGDIPALREIFGNVAVNGTITEINFDKGVGYLLNKQQINVSDANILIPWTLQRPVFATMQFVAKGDIAAASKLLSYKPLDIENLLPFDSEKAKGNVSALVHLKFPVTKDEPRGPLTYDAKVDFHDVSLQDRANTIAVANAKGTIDVTQEYVKLAIQGLMNNIPTQAEITQPLKNSNIQSKQKIVLNLDDSIREKYLAFLNDYLQGPITVEITQLEKGKRHIVANLTDATLTLPWLGWKKDKNIVAKAEFDVPESFLSQTEYTIENFSLNAANLEIAGYINIKNKKISYASFYKANVNKGDDIRLDIMDKGDHYFISITGVSFDARALIQQVSKASLTGDTTNNIEITANFVSVTGFNGEKIENIYFDYKILEDDAEFYLHANNLKKRPVSVQMIANNQQTSLTVNSDDAGHILRFINLYNKIEGGTLQLQLQSKAGKPLKGPVTLNNFTVVNEEKLEKLVSSKPNNGQSLNEAMQDKINSSTVYFDLAYSEIIKGDNSLGLEKGIVRGPVVGASFQGTLYDAAGNMAITGTFMPAYGLNSIFKDIPLVGQILGNGRDGGVLGITFKISGNAKQPQIMVNPLSIIAPGIFRSIFEFQ